MAILDAYGRPIRKARLRQEIAGPSTTAVRPIISTHQSVAIMPTRLASILREAENGYGTAYVDLAEEMEEKDLHYQAVLGTRKRQVSQLSITVEPAMEHGKEEPSKAAEADADLVRDWLDRGELEDELFDIMDAVGKGYSVHEIIWDMSERQWMPARLQYQLPRWFIFDRETGRELKLRDPAGEHGWLDLEPAKFVVHRHAAKSGLPIRGGLARSAAWAWMFKNFTMRDWVRFVEAYGMPLRVGKYDKGATEAEKDVLLGAVRNIAADQSAIIPDGMMIEFVTAQSGTINPDMYHGLLRYIDAQVSKAVLGQTLTTDSGQDGSGSYALGEVHDEVRHDIERSDARQLAATLNRDIVKPLVELNHGPRKALPRIVIGREERMDPAVLSEALSKLVPLGLKVKAEEVRATLMLSMPEGEDENAVLEKPEPVMPPPGFGGPGGPDEEDPDEDEEQAVARALARRKRRARDGIDVAVEGLLAGDGWEPLMDPVIEPILAEASAAVARGDGLEDFRARLPELFARMDDAELVETMRRMGFSAALSGMVGDG